MWHKTGTHRWEAWGMVVDRHWTTVGVKKTFFLFYTDKDSHHAGNHTQTLSSLKEAKDFGQQWLNDELNRDLKEMEG